MSNIDCRPAVPPLATDSAPAVQIISRADAARVSAAVLANLDEWAQDARGAYASNTERAFRADLRVWRAWCGGRELPFFPAEPTALVAFIDDMGGRGRKPATIARYMTSIRKLHDKARLPDPTKAEAVRLALRRLRRAKGTRQRQATAITVRERTAMLAACGADLRGLRDSALLTVAADTLARRSELVALQVVDVTLDPEDGSGVALIRRSKTDQDGQGDCRYLAPATVRALRTWLEAAGARGDGPIFRAVAKGGRLGGQLQAQDVARIFRRLAKGAGLPPDVAAGIGGHSTRVGMAQDMIAAGLEIGEVMQAGGWKTPRMVARYSERVAAKRGAAAKLAKLQGRT